MDIQVTDLFEQSRHIPMAAGWIHGEFWTDKDIHTPDSLAELLRYATQPHVIPLSLLAFVSGEPVGTVNLIENDDEARTHLRPWLAALFVLPEFRGLGIGSTLVRTLQQRANSMGIEEMFLGTDIPDFYKALGAVVHEQPADDFYIMRLNCSHYDN